MITTVQSRVKTGAAWLDTHYPGWHNDIDRDRLQMFDGDNCLLGQVWRKRGAPTPQDGRGLSRYSRALAHHNIDGYGAAALGFTADAQEWASLRSHWDGLIASRRTAETPPALPPVVVNVMPVTFDEVMTYLKGMTEEDANADYLRGQVEFACQVLDWPMSEGSALLTALVTGS